MPDAQKVEITIPIAETELLRLLMERFNEEELRKAGILPETSVIRSMTVEVDGRCSFRISAVSITDPSALLEEIARATDPGSTQSGSDPLTIDYEASETSESTQEPTSPGCPVAEQTLLRIRKGRKVLTLRG